MLQKCLLTVLLLSSIPFSFAAKQPERYEVIIVGAGVSGLAAANELIKSQHKVLVLEARNRIGGRIQTINPWGVALDLGASWIHGIINNPVYDLLSKAGVKTLETSYNSDNYGRKLEDTTFYDAEGKKISTAEINALLPLVKKFERYSNRLQDRKLSYAEALAAFSKAQQLQGRAYKIFKQLISLSYEFEYAANLNQLSVQSESSYKESEIYGKEVIFPLGYIQLIGILAKNIPIRLQQEVKTIEYGKNGVELVTQQQRYSAQKVIVTVPSAVLAANKIAFKPALPADKLKAIAEAKMATYDKAFLYFDRLFWDKDKDKEWINLIPTADAEIAPLDIMNYYKFSQQPILLVFTAGETAKQFESLADEQVIDTIMSQLQHVLANEQSLYLG